MLYDFRTACSRSGLWVACAAGIALSGCATSLRGTDDTVFVQSAPAGAAAVTDLRNPRSGDFYGCSPTPCSFDMPRRSSAIVTVSLAGYPDIQYPVVSSVTTSNDVLPPGVQVAGVAPGPVVIVDAPSRGSQVTLRSASLASGLFTVGAAPVIDAASGANHNLVPKAVTVVFDVSALDDAADNAVTGQNAGASDE